MQNTNRKLYLDVLRIIAIFFVLFTHTGTNGTKLYTIIPDDRVALQFIYTMLDCLRTINNPLLFMISGALLLGKNENIGIIWKKRVVKFLIVLILFSYIQAIWNCITANDWTTFNIWIIFKEMLSNPIRLQYWYLYSYISFLVMLPFLRSIAQKLNDSQFCYLFILSIITMDIFPLLSLKLGIEEINFSIFLNSFTTLYPLLGYYLDCHSEKFLKKWMYPIIEILMVIGIIIAAQMTIWNHNITGQWEEKYITLFYTFTAVAVFLIIKKCIAMLETRNLIKPHIIDYAQFVSSTTFGIYLLENILEAFTRPMFIVFNQFMPKFFACIMWLIVTMLVGSIIVVLLKKIPGLRKIL